MVHAATTFRYVFDAREGDVYWCTADCGWITGHSYLTYGPLLNGATQVVFEGVPTWPDAGRMWQIIDKYQARGEGCEGRVGCKCRAVHLPLTLLLRPPSPPPRLLLPPAPLPPQVSLFYTAPTLVRSLERLGDAPVKASSRASLRVLGTVGEPINPAAWEWFFTVVGDSRCPIVDTWWQTETGGHMITPLPGAHALKPGSAGLPFFGVVPALLDGLGHEIVGPGEGVLVLKAAWPGAARTLFEDSPRFEATYYAPYPGYFYTSDGARRDADGYYTITGRVDDVINVSGARYYLVDAASPGFLKETERERELTRVRTAPPGHRIGTAEVESALVANPSCAEAAVVGVDHPIKGQGIYAFVSLMAGVAPSDALRKQLVDSVRASIGAFASPDTIHWAPALPKARTRRRVPTFPPPTRPTNTALPPPKRRAAARSCAACCARSRPTSWTSWATRARCRTRVWWTNWWRCGASRGRGGDVVGGDVVRGTKLAESSL